MKNPFKYFKSIFSILLLLFLVSSCKDYQELDIEPVNAGDADVSSYVAVGNSLTAGYQNNALYKSAQEFSFPNLLARQFQIADDFSQPLISDPGISPGGGRIELTSLEPIQTRRNPNLGSPLNSEDKPFSNLGVPGAVLVDYLNPNNSGHLKERATDTNNPAFNPFYGIVMEPSELQKAAPNIHNQVAKQEPTLITFWLGNNDVLNYVTSGGEGQAPTDPNTFNQLYQSSAQAMAATGADVVVYNIPDVTSIPFVFYLRLQLEQQGAIVFNESSQTYQLVTPQGNFDIYIDVDGNSEVMRKDDFPLLTAQSYFAQVQAGSTPPPISPQNPIPDQLVLDGKLGDNDPTNSELERAVGALTQYNTTIENTAASFGFALVNINTIFNDILTVFQSSGGQDGYHSNGLNLRPVPGEIFSFDGVHPTNRGSAIIANETIDAMNEAWNGNISKINLAKIPEGFPVASE